LEVLVLASGSSGNATLVRSGSSALLVDVGISTKQVSSRLAEFDLTPSAVTAALITHEHTDHARGLGVFVRRFPVPVWATAGTWAGLEVVAPAGGELRSGRWLRLGDLRVLAVPTSHDAREPVALLISDGTTMVGLCTDTGAFTNLLAERLRGCHLLLIETNHDTDMLRNGPYPWPLKQRIASRTGHLANHQTAEAVDRVRSSDLRAVVGLHLSAENNLPELALETLNRCLQSAAPVHAVPRSEMLRITLEERVRFERRAVPVPRRRSG
jgi:phosphoribosyl 1,2-cyclic phosphodiesterase